MRRYWSAVRCFAFVLTTALVLCACGQKSALPVATNNGQTIAQTRSATSIIHVTGSHFWEYPVGFATTSLANGSANTLWFTCPGWALCELNASTGTVTRYPAPYAPPPPPRPIYGYYYAGEGVASSSVVKVNTAFWYALRVGYFYRRMNCPPCHGYAVSRYFVTRTTPPVYTTEIPLQGTFTSNLALGADGNIWFADGSNVDRLAPSGSSSPVTVAHITQNTVGLTAPLNNHLYLGGYNGGNLQVYDVSTGGAILHEFALPYNEGIDGVALGPVRTGNTSGDVWVTIAGLNELIRITAAGSQSPFVIPTGSAYPYGVTAVPGTVDANSALWFTENSSNKIGRISTAGAIAEHTIPTANAQPAAIIPCPASVCGAYGGVWFAELGSQQIGRYDFP